MSDYFFVPGGKRAASDWDQVRAILEQAGHQTQAITLSDPEHATLQQHIDEVCAALAEWDAGPVHLVGHSYASFVITGAAAAQPHSIAGLVYVDSLIPASGRSLWDYFTAAGQDLAAYGVPTWPPFTAPLVFDPAVLQPLSKAYVHCLRSQFLALTNGPVRYVKARAASDHWRYFEIDADHYVMLNHAPELAAILAQC